MISTKKGFTIIELLVVMTIIALLTGIVVANLSTAKSRSRDAKRISDIAQLQLAMELFFDRCNQYPRIDGTAVTATPSSVLLAASNGCPPGITFGTFIGTVPTAPTPGSSYTYAINSATAPVDYVLRAVLENTNQVLTDAPTATLYGTTCTHSAAPWYYCVQPR